VKVVCVDHAFDLHELEGRLERSVRLEERHLGKKLEPVSISLVWRPEVKEWGACVVLKELK